MVKAELKQHQLLGVAVGYKEEMVLFFSILSLHSHNCVT